MVKKLVIATTAVVLGAVVIPGALAQVKPEVLVKQRQAKMILQGKYYGPMAAMAQGKAPFNGAVVQRNAGFLDNLTRMAWDGYDPSTKDEKSRTLPAAYENKVKFNDYVNRLENEAAKLVAVSTGGDEAAVKAQIGAVGKVCGGCHEDFRSK
jgi:cytochrome c556